MKHYLGIIDWGIGGVSIYKLIKSKLGNVPIIYFSDTGVMPYGMMSRQVLVSRLNNVIEFLRSQGVTHLIVGCNAASTVLTFLDVGEINVEGVIKSAVRATSRMRPTNLALIGGKRTVLSGVYRRAFEGRAIDVTQRIAQPLSALIEDGDVSSPELRKQCRRILSPIRNCSHLLLACTHYPAIIPLLKEVVSEDTILIDPVVELVNGIKRWELPTGGPDRFLTTGNSEKMKQSAWRAFHVKITTARTIRI